MNLGVHSVASVINRDAKVVEEIGSGQKGGIEAWEEKKKRQKRRGEKEEWG